MTRPIVDAADLFEELGLDVDRTHIDQNKILAKDDEEAIWCHVPATGANYGTVKVRELKAAEKHQDAEDIEWLAVNSGMAWETLDVDLYGLLQTLDAVDDAAARLVA